MRCSLNLGNYPVVTRSKEPCQLNFSSRGPTHLTVVDNRDDYTYTRQPVGQQAPWRCYANSSSGLRRMVSNVLRSGLLIDGRPESWRQLELGGDGSPYQYG